MTRTQNGHSGPTTEQMIGQGIRHTLGLEDRIKRVEERFASAEVLQKRLTQPAAGNESAWDSFGEFLIAARNACRDGRVDKRLIESRAASGLTGSEAPDLGGFVMPQEFSDVLMRMVRYSAPIASLAMNIPAGGRSISMPAIDETSRANGSRWGGVSSTWDTEADTVTATKPKFRRLELNLKRLMSLIYVTAELSEDASALGAFIANAFTAEAAFQFDDMILSGNGSGQPLGILNSPGLITVAKDSGQTGGTITATNVASAFSRMLPESRRRAVWLVSPEVEESLYVAPLIVGTAGSANNLFSQADADAPFGRLMSRPIIPVEQAAAMGTAGDALFVDLSMYAIYEKPLDLRMSMDVRFLNGEAVYRMRYRVDGAPIIKSAITQRYSGVTKSAYVAIATRT